MFGYIVIILSATVATLAALDLLLSEIQKTGVSDGVARLWSWLDDRGRVSYLGYIKLRRNQRILFVCFTSLLFLLVVLFAFAISDFKYDKTIFGVIPLVLVLNAPLLVCFSPPSMTFITSPPSKVGVGLRLFSVIVLSFLAGGLIYAFFNWMYPQPVQGGSASVPNLNFTGLFSIAISYLLLLAVVIISALPFVLIAVLRLVLIVVEFVVRRIAESSKGPIIAASMIIGSFVALVKVFM